MTEQKYMTVNKWFWAWQFEEEEQWLAQMAAEELGWKKSTTYSILKRVSERGLFQNVDGVVTSCVKKDEFMAKQTEQFLDANFEGSLPKFLAAFAKKNKFSEKEIEEINKIIRS